MDSLETLAFARSLIDIDSTTGREAEAGQWLAARLRALGYNVLEQTVERGCANILATLDDPAVVFSTHFDCVPPFFPSRVEMAGCIGRGACDAKGILAAQVAAAERLRAAGERRVGLLFVVGEERGSDGAVAANTIPNRCRFLINGEPTDSRLATATRGILRVRLTRGWSRRAFGGARAGRVGDREAPRRPRRVARAAAARRSRSRRDLLHRRPDRRRRGAERDSRARVRRGDVPHDRIGRRHPGGAPRGWSRAWRFREVLRVPADPHAHGLRVRDAVSSRSRPTCRCSIAGARRSSLARVRFSWRIPTSEFVTLDELHAAVDGFERLASCRPLGLVRSVRLSRTGSRT